MDDSRLSITCYHRFAGARGANILSPACSGSFSCGAGRSGAVLQGQGALHPAGQGGAVGLCGFGLWVWVCGFGGFVAAPAPAEGSDGAGQPWSVGEMKLKLCLCPSWGCPAHLVRKSVGCCPPLNRRGLRLFSGEECAEWHNG